MKSNIHYASYKHYIAKFDASLLSLELTEEESGAVAVLGLSRLLAEDGQSLSFSDFENTSVSLDLRHEKHIMHIAFTSARDDLPSPEIYVTVDSRGISLKIAEIGHYTFVGEGYVYHGGDTAYAINTKDTPSDAIRAAIGPAASKYDNAVFDRETDSAFEISGCRGLSMSYDFAHRRYRYVIKTKSEGVAEIIRFSLVRNLLAEKYDIDYSPMRLGRRYQSPPAGFMTWYSLKFDACEARVLENAEFQSKHLAPYGANTVWVDWEWCHRRYERERFDGVNNFNPDPEKYPHGLGYLADKIKRLGMVPALWLGFTNDVGLTEYEREHPEISLSHHDTWSGRYYYDMSHPEYINGYLTEAVGQVKAWGFEAVKYDTLPNAIYAHENYHANMLRPERSTYTVFREMIGRVRELLGEDCYMLSCGSAGQVVLWGSGIFDAARIGPDLFDWEKYVETIDRIRYYYALHSNTVFCDPDCVVLRDEYSTLEQAKSRVLPVSLLGLPLNFGDELTRLPEERLELLRRALPTVNAHPTDFNTAVSDGKTQLVVLKIALPYESYAVAALVNLTDTERSRDVSLSESLRLEDGGYLIYDYFADGLLGIFDESIYMTVKPYDTRLVAVRRVTGVPQIVSSSRHFTQGATDILNADWCEDDLTLKVTARLVKEDVYRLSIYLPEGYTAESTSLGVLKEEGRLLRVSVVPPHTGDFDLVVKFRKNCA